MWSANAALADMAKTGIERQLKSNKAPFKGIFAVLVSDAEMSVRPTLCKIRHLEWESPEFKDIKMG
jgi:hypothetical protein